MRARGANAAAGRARAALALAVIGSITAVGLTSCRPPPRPAMAPPAAAGPAPTLVRTAHHPPLVDDADPASLAAAVRASVEFYGRLPPDRLLDFGGDHVRADGMREALLAFATVLDARPAAAELARELERRFVVYRAGAAPSVLFTGYYLPVVDARAAADARFRIPVLGRPPDLVTAAPSELGADCAQGVTVSGRLQGGRLAPYPTRAEIEAGALRDTPVLAWVSDPVAYFFLQIQGTGRLAFPGGGSHLIGYAGSNGRPYVSIGKMLVAEGQLPLEEASMQGIRRWIADHPEQRERVLHANPRYVFFRPLAGAALGSLGVPVTGGRTLATDPAVYPPGALAFVHGPAAPPADGLERLMVNQDTGAAIRGPGHVDVFFGEGADAELGAGRLHSDGELYFLAPRQVAG
ncbi:MAG TPA: MltA domain-containing protein [Candidatus Binatia bacterium]